MTENIQRNIVPVRRADDIPGKDGCIKVSIDRLNAALTFSGEIGLAQNRLSVLCDAIKNGLLSDVKLLDEAVSHMGSLISDMQNSVMKIHMQPLDSLYCRYPRHVREIASQIETEIEVVMSGGDNELDKNMIIGMYEALTSLVHNAACNIEPVEQRKAHGKPEKGTVRIDAQQNGDSVIITVEDDGNGMSLDSIRKRAIESGLVANNIASGFSDDQIMDLLFLPGFISIPGRSNHTISSAKDAIQKMNGKISVKTHTGKGTIFKIVLPMTLSVLPVLVLQANDQLFAVPSSYVKEIITIYKEDIKLVNNRPVISIREEVLPIIGLANVLGWGDDTDNTVGVLIQIGENKLMITSKGVIGNKSVVVKKMDTYQPHGVMGATMSTDGEVMLILEMKSILDGLF